MEIPAEGPYRYLTGAGRLLARGRDYICPLSPIIRRIPRNATHLDIGCGRGVLLGAVTLEKGTRSTGCEPSGVAVKAAQKMAAQLAAQSVSTIPTVVQVSVPEQWPVGPFDVVTIIDVLHHVPSKEKPAFLMAVAHRVRPGGILIFKDMALRPHWKRIMNTLHDLIFARQLVHYTPLDQVVALFHSQGLQLMETERYSVLWYAHELAVLQRPS